MGQLSVFILSAFPSVTEGLKTFLMSNEFINVFDCPDNFASAFKNLIKKRPDILFIDDAFFDREELQEFLNSLPKAFSSTKIIVYTGSNDPLYLKNLIESGVPGIIHKKSSREEIIEAIMIVSVGKVYFGKLISKEIFNYEIKLKAFNDENLSQLSKRELEVIECICKGLSNKEIAEDLKVSVKTVEKHKERIKLKAGMKSIKELYEYLESIKLLN